MSKYAMNPVVVDAIQYEEGIGLEDGLVAFIVDMEDEEYIERVFSGKNCWKSYSKLVHDLEGNRHIDIDKPAQPYINTIGGRKFISNGDYIITGVLGERYVCHPDIFKEYYTQVED